MPLVLIEADDLRALVSGEVEAAVSRALAGATITPAPEWVTIKQAADMLGVTPDAIRKRIRDGRMEARGSGAARMVRIAE